MTPFFFSLHFPYRGFFYFVGRIHTCTESCIFRRAMYDGANSFALFRAIETAWPKLWAFVDHLTGVDVAKSSPVWSPYLGN